MREPKELQIVEGGHIPSLAIAIPAIYNWLDRTMGPVWQ